MTISTVEGGTSRATNPAAVSEATRHEQPTAAEDVGTALMRLMIESRGVLNATSRDEIDRSYERMEKARRDYAEALKRSEEAQESSGFWGDVADFLGGDVATLAALVGSLALAVGTFGAATPLTVVLCVGALASAGASLGRELGLDPTLCLALSGLGAATGLIGGQYADAAKLWTTIHVVASGVQGGATAAGGAATIGKGHYEAEALHAQADATQARGIQDDQWLLIDLAIGDLERASREVQRGQSTAGEIQRTQQETRTSVIARIGTA